MKNILLLLLFFTYSSIAQDYVPMAIENAQWRVFKTDADNLPPFNDAHYGYVIKGDTIINSIMYKKVYKRNFTPINSDINNPLVGPYTVGADILFGAIRDDILNKQVYAIIFDLNLTLNYPCNENEEVLLYDFSMEVGDHFDEICLHNDNAGPLAIGEIIQTDLYGENRQVQIVHEWYPDLPSVELPFQIFEGIGNNTGPFEAFCYFECPYYTDMTNYCIGTDQECFDNVNYILSNEENILEEKIKIYPNPVHDKLNIQIPFVLTNEINIKITDTLQKTVANFNTNTTQELDISPIKSGVYFVYIIQNNKIQQINKIIKL